MHRPIAAALAVLVAGSIAAGCGAFPDPYGTHDQILGPWRAEPLAVDPATISVAEEACEEARTRVRPDMAADRLVAIDARGTGRITMLFSGAGSVFMQCELRMDSGGELSMAGGWAQKEEGPDLLLAQDGLRIVNSGGMLGGVDLASNVSGRIGPAVASVRLVFAAGPVVHASIGGGWFIAWWPTDDMDFVVEAYDVTGRKIAQADQ